MPDTTSEIFQQVTSSDLVVTVLHKRTGNEPWMIWLGLERGDPRNQDESFIIGQAMTRERAMAKAVQLLAGAISAIPVASALAGEAK